MSLTVRIVDITLLMLLLQEDMPRLGLLLSMRGLLALRAVFGRADKKGKGLYP